MGHIAKPPPNHPFSGECANNFYKEKYSTPVTINEEDLAWFPEVENPTVS